MSLRSEWWKLALAVVIGGGGIALVAGELVVSHPPGTTQAAYRTFIDVTTGDRYVFRQRGRTLPIPGEHPETGRRMLYPIHERENGELFVSLRYLDGLPGPNEDIDLYAAIDLETGRVTPSSRRPETLED